MTSSEPTRWLRYAGLGVGVLVVTVATIGLIYLGVNAMLSPDEIVGAEDPAPAAEPARQPVPEAPARPAPEPEPIRRPAPEPEPIRRPPEPEPIRPPAPEPEPPPPPAPEPEPPPRPAPEPAPPPRPTPVPEPTPPRPSPASSPVDLLVRVVDAEESVLAGVAITLSPGDFTEETNERGEWEFEGLPPGEYQITASRDGYYDVDRTVQVDVGLAERLTEEIVLTPTPVLDTEVLVGWWNQAKADAEQAKADVTLTLEEYSSAYKDLDTDGIQEVYPEAPIDGIQRHFDSVNSYEAYDFTPPEFTALDVTAGTATVEATLQRKFDARVGGAQEPDETDVEITFVRQDDSGRWLISEVRFKQ
ncbi:MAG TPA: carboxypeptidase-like regulatory domain-containing protein [Vicinamibacterales bacterium]|nr:carboxypeptidase-like regulatory domain-containing protein [Vicinamibacterales bacterium]